MAGEAARWSPDRQRVLQTELPGRYAEDLWVLEPDRPMRDGQHRLYFRFRCESAGLNTELKYALWRKLTAGSHAPAMDTQFHWSKYLAYLVAWLNRVAPAAPSLLERSLRRWEVSLRSHLVERGQLRRQTRHTLSKAQAPAPSVEDDKRIQFFRQLYALVEAAYDERAELDKDVWDLRTMGVTLPLTRSKDTLSFTRLQQPWLRQLAKRYCRYNLSVHSVDDTVAKMTALNVFSGFLARHAPRAAMADLDRALMLEYMASLREHTSSHDYRSDLLHRLRTVLEVAAYRLQVPGLTQTRLIYDDDLPRRRERLPRDLPEGVLDQLRQHLATLPPPLRPMVVIALECGLRLSELCALRRDCLAQDSRGRFSLQFYQAKRRREHLIPLVDDGVVAAIQAQQEAVRNQHGPDAPWLFPRPTAPHRPYAQASFSRRLNRWAVEQAIVGPDGKLWRFEGHQFRHTMAMRLLNDDVPLDTIRRLLGHGSLRMTVVYATKRAEQVRAELERARGRRVTIDAAGQVVAGDPRGDDADLELLHAGLRGSVLPVGGCGRLRVLGPCEHENRCLTCPFWRTSTDDLPQLDAMLSRARRLLPLAQQGGNPHLIQNLERVVPLLQQRTATLRRLSQAAAPSPGEQARQVKQDLARAEAGLDEARAAGLWLTVKTLEQTIREVTLRLTALEWEGVADGPGPTADQD